MLLQQSRTSGSRFHQRRHAFTLLEILVVVAIIVVLVGVGGMMLLPRVDESKVKVAKSQLRLLTDACQTYYLNNEQNWPPSLAALAGPQPNGGAPILEQTALADPWGQPYGYDPSGAHNGGHKPDIWVTRPTGQIGNWTGNR
jgi:general secretion pathway protein G